MRSTFGTVAALLSYLPYIVLAAPMSDVSDLEIREADLVPRQRGCNLGPCPARSNREIYNQACIAVTQSNTTYAQSKFTVPSIYKVASDPEKNPFNEQPYYIEQFLAHQISIDGPPGDPSYWDFGREQPGAWITLGIVLHKQIGENTSDWGQAFYKAPWINPAPAPASPPFPNRAPLARAGNFVAGDKVDMAIVVKNSRTVYLSIIKNGKPVTFETVTVPQRYWPGNFYYDGQKKDVGSYMPALAQKRASWEVKLWNSTYWQSVPPTPRGVRSVDVLRGYENYMPGFTPFEITPIFGVNGKQGTYVGPKSPGYDIFDLVYGWNGDYQSVSTTTDEKRHTVGFRRYN